MYIVTSNEKTSMTSAERRQDVSKIYSTLTASPIVLWQEINGSIEHGDIQAMAPAGTYHAFGNLPIPVSVPQRFTVLDEYWRQTKVWTGKDAEVNLGSVGDNERYFAVLKLQDTNSPKKNPFYLINTHLTNGCEWEESSPTSTALALRDYWEAHWDILDSEIDNLKNADHTVFWGGDFNRKNCPQFGTAEKLAVGDGRVDKLGVIDRSLRTTLIETGTIITNSDHNARWAKWDVANRPA